MDETAAPDEAPVSSLWSCRDSSVDETFAQIASTMPIATMRRLMAKSFSPIILSTWRFGQIANAAGWPMLARGGKAIDAVEQGCIAVESDPEVDSVGIGGTPDAD